MMDSGEQLDERMTMSRRYTNLIKKGSTVLFYPPENPKTPIRIPDPGNLFGTEALPTSIVVGTNTHDAKCDPNYFQIRDDKVRIQPNTILLLQFPKLQFLESAISNKVCTGRSGNKHWMLDLSLSTRQIHHMIKKSSKNV